MKTIWFCFYNVVQGARRYLKNSLFCSDCSESSFRLHSGKQEQLIASILINFKIFTDPSNTKAKEDVREREILLTLLRFALPVYPRSHLLLPPPISLPIPPSPSLSFYLSLHLSPFTSLPQSLSPSHWKEIKMYVLPEYNYLFCN